MSEQDIVIITPDGKAPAKLFTPEGRGPWPGVLHLTDIWGIRPANEKMARHIAGQGYAVLLPHLFYRTQPVPFDPLLKGEARDMGMVPQLASSVPPAKMVSDGIAYVDALLGRPEVSGKKVAVVGYCFSGSMALRIAAAAPDKVAAAVSFHGGRLATPTPQSPHLEIPKIKGELYFGHASDDQSMPPDQIQVLDEALQAWGGKFHSEVYEGTKHGWAVEGRPEIYNPAQAERHFVKLFELLERTLK